MIERGAVQSLSWEARMMLHQAANTGLTVLLNAEPLGYCLIAGWEANVKSQNVVYSQHIFSPYIVAAQDLLISLLIIDLSIDLLICLLIYLLIYWLIYAPSTMKSSAHTVLLKALPCSTCCHVKLCLVASGESAEWAQGEWLTGTERLTNYCTLWVSDWLPAAVRSRQVGWKDDKNKGVKSFRGQRRWDKVWTWWRLTQCESSDLHKVTSRSPNETSAR